MPGIEREIGFNVKPRYAPSIPTPQQDELFYQLEELFENPVLVSHGVIRSFAEQELWKLADENHITGFQAALLDNLQAKQDLPFKRRPLRLREPVKEGTKLAF